LWIQKSEQYIQSIFKKHDPDDEDVLLPGVPNFNYNYVDQYGRNKIND